jgi:[ribosomal protein S5]-alanine N-acetyltransferase
MSARPTLHTKRCLLRPFRLEDSETVRILAGDRTVADTTLNLPHPYVKGLAQDWINSHPEEFDQGRQVIFAIVRQEDDQLLGAIGLVLETDHSRGEIGYWIGKPYWNNGYCTEAAQRVLTYGFDDLKLFRIQARHFKRNAASGRVMQKCGMLHEGSLRGHIQKWAVFEDIEIFGMLSTDTRR